MTNNLVLALAAIVIFGVAGAAAINFAYEENQERVDITGETVNVSSLDKPLELENSNITDATYDEADDITVRNASGNITENGTDYTWHQSNGTITFLSSGVFSAGDDAEVDYGYITPDELQKGMIRLFGTLYDWWPFLVFVVGILILLRATGEL